MNHETMIRAMNQYHEGLISRGELLRFVALYLECEETAKAANLVCEREEAVFLASLYDPPSRG